MPELLERLGQLANERGESIQRASRELAGEPEGFLILARDLCRYVGLLADYWEVVELQLRKGGILPPFGNRPFSAQTANCGSPTICGQRRLGKVDLSDQGQTDGSSEHRDVMVK
jgi:hypothetical protein